MPGVTRGLIEGDITSPTRQDMSVPSPLITAPTDSRFRGLGVILYGVGYRLLGACPPLPRIPGDAVCRSRPTRHT